MRVRFTLNDLAKMRMVSTLGPVVEGVFALDLLRGRGNSQFGEWRKQVRRRLAASGAAGENVERLLAERRPLSELLFHAGHAPDSTGAGADESGRVTAAVYEFCRVAVLPYWSGVSALLQAEREARGRIAIGSGVEGMLDTLNLRMCVGEAVLEVPDRSGRELRLDGRGLVLSPSLFLAGGEHVVIESAEPGGPPTLVFAMPSTASTLAELWGTAEPNEQALAALVGHTRAAALQALIESCTTGTLSQRLGISLAGASKHATVLRQAGLITTARNRNTVLHTLTPLGLALLRSRVPAQPPRGQAATTGRAA
ncbi:winged helix-turn-helix domain-containing protein [Allokutzneria sp. A3M-2-11 16]|uniref:ArsR/SmtB family transcription factor n=1 Tax=Allokutzneria sp. A3M-2-11 16 TaxID=2962043 RepID=UPI0020B765F7|nr:winged helix-turn-helix domain-containing protein [Allokutzneria sp. A3M-2-11 16]MCP3804325.1 winged helix-turn-helix domain-containing protein [Allokutzneria sp. A3M-2-11 16]